MAAISSGITTGGNGGGGVGGGSSSLLFPSIVELNVGGVHYTTTLSTLTRDPDSLLGQMFTGRAKSPVLRDSKGKYFIDRDGVLFRYTLDFLRNQKLTLPENFHECERLRQEADYFQMSEMRTTLMAAIASSSSRTTASGNASGQLLTTTSSSAAAAASTAPPSAAAAPLASTDDEVAAPEGLSKLSPLPFFSSYPVVIVENVTRRTNFSSFVRICSGRILIVPVVGTSDPPRRPSAGLHHAGIPRDVRLRPGRPG